MANGKIPANADQHVRFLETARALGCDEDEAAFDEKLKAILTSPASTDAQMIDAFDKGLKLGSKHIARSLKAIADSKVAINEADKLTQGRDED